ncbi:MAG TPA: hypothetical protein VH024_13600 [Candidatus Angelobacter sp.]|jgi:hypothetical protein|nr:hypothetical protein [Candidatus Angelobacter sp.]
MGIRSMVQFTVRVAAFAAVAALLLQVFCMVGPPAVTNAQLETHSDSGCHESAPPAPNTPDSSHSCCIGDHPDALLSAFATPAPLVIHEGVLDLASALGSFAPSSTFIDFPASFSPPHGLLALRI